LEFVVGDHVLIMVLPITGVGRAMRSIKLMPKFLRPIKFCEG